MTPRRRITTVLLLAASRTSWGQGPPPPPPPPRGPNPGSLKTVPLPQFTNAGKYIKDQTALVALGKALFWDMQTGSDGRMACATCHFHAGADHRTQNQLSNSFSAFVADQSLTADQFPFHVLANATDNRSPVLRDSPAVAGSQGIFRRIFAGVIPGSAADDGSDAADRPAFSLAGVNVRQVTVRNAPSVINAVFNFRNFWDGRASNIFTGLTPFGASDTGLNAMVLSNGQLAPEVVHVENSSLASQAVGPPANDQEMSYSGRTWPQIGRKMLSLSPLAKQRVAPDDSVLGPLANSAAPGLLPQYSYLSMVRSAFQPQYWSSDQLVAGEFTQAEFNFAVFWGLAVQAYEATLVSDDSRFDQFAEGKSAALTSQEQTGMNIFRRNGGCQICHTGAEFTAASLSNIARQGQVQRGRNGLGPDTGFFHTGVRPVADDIGLGGVDSFGNPLSIAVAQSANAQPAVNGLFKSPALRNAEFTGPYFHDGGQATLEQVVDFYDRGGDFPAGGNPAPGIRRLNLSPDDRAALTAFLKSLSDDRVRFERAPFDHPELCVPLAQDTTKTSSDPRFALSAVDRWAGIPVVGRNGNPVPLQTFEELLLGIGTDGSRAHTLADSCAIP